MQKASMEKLKTVNDIRKAVEEGRLFLDFQPIVGLDGRVRGSEALLRIINEDGTIIPPDKFIRTAEETGLIIPMGLWVLEMAVNEAVRWHASGFPDLYVSVNLSVKQLKSEEFFQRVQDLLKRTGLDPEHLRLEVTESCFIDPEGLSVGLLERINSLGIKISLDDFGTGYSSLSYLKDLPVDIIKIDRSFVQGLPSDKHGAAIVEAVFAMARGLALEVVAEGIETVLQADYLSLSGCDAFQGFLYSRPLPAEAFLAYCRSKNRTADDRIITADVFIHRT
jgi:EAL domain-containing protein (putative c-di-GMP-specific phosphodiesterase class I)